jgi:hypothetical protein
MLMITHAGVPARHVTSMWSCRLRCTNECDEAVSRLPIFLIRYNEDFGQVMVEESRAGCQRSIFRHLGMLTCPENKSVLSELQELPCGTF